MLRILYKQIVTRTTRRETINKYRQTSIPSNRFSAYRIGNIRKRFNALHDMAENALLAIIHPHRHCQTNF